MTKKQNLCLTRKLINEEKHQAKTTVMMSLVLIHYKVDTNRSLHVIIVVILDPGIYERDVIAGLPSSCLTQML